MMSVLPLFHGNPSGRRGAGRVLGCVVLAGFLLWRKEWYPFSHFPMYSGLPEDVWTVELTDAEDHPIPMLAVFHTSISNLKKIVNSNNRSGKEALKLKRKADLPETVWAASGRAALDWLAARTVARRRGALGESKATAPLLFGPWKLWRYEFAKPGQPNRAGKRTLLAMWAADDAASDASDARHSDVHDAGDARESHSEVGR
jgi:hypothetical protein